MVYFIGIAWCWIVTLLICAGAIIFIGLKGTFSLIAEKKSWDEYKASAYQEYQVGDRKITIERFER